MSGTDHTDRAAGPTGCPAALNVLGEHFDCDWPTVDEKGNHPGWNHTSQAAQAVWTDDRNSIPTAVSE